MEGMKPLTETPHFTVSEAPDLLVQNAGSPAEIDTLIKVISQQEEVIEKKTTVIEEQKKRIAQLEEYLRLERARLYGRSSEKNQQQGDIFNEVEQADDAAEAQEDDTTSESKKPRPKKQGRKPLSPSLPRFQERVELTEEEKAGAVDTFFTKVREELDIIPAKVRVKEILQEKAVFLESSADDQPEKRVIKAAELPKHPIPKSAVTTSMLAYIIVAKYCDALPLYRLENILSRYGGSVTRTTMANWLIRLSAQLQGLINLMYDHQRTGIVINADETRIQVLKEPGKSINSDKYMWVTLGGPPGETAVLFEYDPSRGKEVPLRLLEGFHGYLQTDGYTSYNAVSVQEGIIQLGCFDHVRRKFVDAKKGEAKEKSKKKMKATKVSKADVALGKIAKLYAVEADIQSLPVDEKKQQRQLRSKPLLDDLKAWLEKNIVKVVPDSLVHTAMKYALNQWPKLVVYCENGHLNISNAAAENAIRPFTVGRKNWLFADTPKGARASAVYYSLIESAKVNGLEPYAYLSHVLKKLPYADTVEQLEVLLPWAVKESGECSKNE